MFFVRLTLLLPLPPPAQLKSVAKVVRGDFSGVGSTLGSSEAFRWGSGPGQKRPYGSSHSPKKACWVRLGPGACTHNAGVTPSVALAPGLSLAVPVPGKTAVASAVQCCWWVKSPSSSKPSQSGRLLRRVVAADIPPSVPPDPATAWVSGQRRPARLPICSHQRPSVGARGCISIPVFPWACEPKPLQRGRPPHPHPCGGAAGPQLCWSPSPSLAAHRLAPRACLKPNQKSVYSGGKKSLLIPGFSKNPFFNVSGSLARSPLITL